MVLGRDGGERRASAVAASTVWRRDTEEHERDFQRPGREAPKPRTKRRGGLLPNEIRDSGGPPRLDLPQSIFPSPQSATTLHENPAAYCPLCCATLMVRRILTWMFR